MSSYRAIRIIVAAIIIWDAGFSLFEPACAMESSPVPDAQSSPPPWFTGTLLSNRGRTLDQGDLIIQPYLYYTQYGGVYTNNWRAQSATTSQNLIQQTYYIYGLTDYLDIELCPQWIQNYSQGKTSHGLGDFSMSLGYQVVKGRENSWVPFVRFWVQELFPTGRFDNLGSTTALVEATGGGSFATTFGLSIQKPIKLDGHVLRYRLNISETLYTSVHVTGFNAYGGGFGTEGVVSPGPVTTLIAAAEYTLTRYWSLALDVSYQIVQATPFSGTTGVGLDGVPATVGRGSREFLSLAPAVEYQVNGQIGLIAGPWFTVTGRNAPAFIGGVAAILFSF